MLEHTDKLPRRFYVRIAEGYTQYVAGNMSGPTYPNDATVRASHSTLLAAWRTLGSYIRGKRRPAQLTRAYIEDDNGRRYTWAEARHILKCQRRI